MMEMSGEECYLKAKEYKAEKNYTEYVKHCNGMQFKL